MAAAIADTPAGEDIPIYRIQTVSALTGIPARRIRSWESQGFRERLLACHGNLRCLCSRPCQLPSVLLEELKSFQDVQVGCQRALGRKYVNHDLVFCQPTGKPLHGHNITQRDFREVIKNAKVPHIRFHDLRHCSATLLLRQGVHPKVVQERLGDSGISITMDTYSHVLPGMQEDAATLLARRLVGGDPGISRHLQNEAEPDETARGSA